MTMTIIRPRCSVIAVTHTARCALKKILETEDRRTVFHIPVFILKWSLADARNDVLDISPL